MSTNTQSVAAKSAFVAVSLLLLTLIVLGFFQPRFISYAVAGWLLFDATCDWLTGRATYGGLVPGMHVERSKSRFGFHFIVGLKIVAMLVLIAAVASTP